MQDPLFERFNINAHDFWEKERADLSATAEKGVRVNPDTYYLNYYIKCAHNGTIPGLNNALLREIGKEQRFYSGIPEIFRQTKGMFLNSLSRECRSASQQRKCSNRDRKQNGQ